MKLLFDHYNFLLLKYTCESKTLENDAFFPLKRQSGKTEIVDQWEK